MTEEPCRVARSWGWWRLGFGLLIIIAVGAYLSTGDNDAFEHMPTVPTAHEEPPQSSPAPIEPPDRAEQLQNLLAGFAAAQAAEFYIYAHDLKTGDSAERQANTAVPSGSIYKLFLANEIYRLNEAGQLDLSRPAGHSGYSIAGCTMEMVQNSLNACGEAIRDLLGAASLTQSLQRQGYTRTDLRKDPAAAAAPRDIALLLERLYEGGYFSPSHTAEFLNYLKNQRYRFRLPEGLPREPAVQGLIGTRNKTGYVFGYTHDAAIILGENTDYILVSMSGPWIKPEDSSNAHRHLSGLVYNFFNGTDYELKY